MMCRVFDDVKEVRVTSPYGYRTHPITKKRSFHSGVDIVPADGSIARVIAHTGGVVVGAGYSQTAGYYVNIRTSDDVIMRYFHLRGNNVMPRQQVKTGQFLGVMGNTGNSTGAHLHFQIEVMGKTVNPECFLYEDIYIIGGDQMTKEEVIKLMFEAEKERQNQPLANDKDSIDAREWAIMTGIFKGSTLGPEWRREPTRNEMAIALMRLYQLLQKP